MDVTRTILLLLIILVATACGRPATPPDRPPLRVAYDLWPGYYPLVIAQQQGYFADQGIRVESNSPEDTDEIIADFAAGKYDGLAVAMGDIINITQVNPDVHIIFVTDESAGGDAVLVTPEIQTISDLRGKRIGTNLGGFGELFVTTMLQTHGLSRDDVVWVNVDAAEIPAKLQSGEIQAGHTWEPYVTQARQAGNQVVFSSQDTPGLIPDVMAFQGDTLRERPDDVRHFVQAWFQAVDTWKANPHQGNEIVAQRLNIPADSISLQGIKLFTLDDNRQVFQPGETNASLYHVAQQYVDFFVQRGALNSAPDVNQLLDPAFLK